MRCVAAWVFVAPVTGKTKVPVKVGKRGEVEQMRPIQSLLLYVNIILWTFDLHPQRFMLTVFLAVVWRSLLELHVLLAMGSKGLPSTSGLVPFRVMVFGVLLHEPQSTPG